jgi:hypothetical protein
MRIGNFLHFAQETPYSVGVKGIGRNALGSLPCLIVTWIGDGGADGQGNFLGASLPAI